jgi:hypothetical protein
MQDGPPNYTGTMASRACPNALQPAFLRTTFKRVRLCDARRKPAAELKLILRVGKRRKIKHRPRVFI